MASPSNDELAKAHAALNSLKKGDIVEMKAYLNPPAAVLQTMSAVMVILGEDTSWANARKVMN